MNGIAEFYESNYSLIFTIITLVTLIIIINKNKQIKKLISNVGELKVKLTELKAKIAEYEIIRIEKVSKSIKVGCVVRLKYVLTGEIITILISEYQSGVIEYQSEIRRINSKMPLAVSLLDKEVGDIVKFKVNISDEKEVYLEVLKVGVEIKQEPKEVIVEEEIINNEVNPIMPKQNRVLHPIAPLKDMTEGFRRWLSGGNNNNGINYAPGTVYAYSNAIRSLSEHLTQHTGQRVSIYNLSVQSIDELKRIRQLYSLRGRYSEFGNTAHGTYRNAMVAYVRFIESLNRN